MTNRKSAKTYKSRRVLLHVKQFILESENSYCNFHILFYILSIVNFHTVLYMFSFLFYWLHLKKGTVYSSSSSLFRKRSIIGQLNVPAATAENGEQYFFSKVICIGFQNSYSCFELLFDKQLFLKGRQISWKKTCSGVYFRQIGKLKVCNFTKSTLLSNFQGFRSGL